MDCCGKIGEVISGILDAIKPILAIVLVCAAIYFAWWAAPGAWTSLAAGISWMPATIVGLSNTALAVVAFGAAMVVDSDTVVAIAAKAAETVGSVVGTIIGAVAGGAATGLFGANGLAWIVGGIAAYYFLTRDKSRDKKADEPAVKQVEPVKAQAAITTGPTDQQGMFA